MFLIVPLLAGCVVGFLRKGSLWEITRLKIKWILLLPLAYVMQYIAIYYLNGISYELLVSISYICLLWFCYLNLKINGVNIAMIGIILNFVVMVVNHLRMPAYLPAVERIEPSAVLLLKLGKVGKSIAMTSGTHFNFLGDIFTFNLGVGSLISIGDILFGIGLAIVIQHAMCLERADSAC